MKIILKFLVWRDLNFFAWVNLPNLTKKSAFSLKFDYYFEVKQIILVSAWQLGIFASLDVLCQLALDLTEG